MVRAAVTGAVWSVLVALALFGCISNSSNDTVSISTEQQQQQQHQSAACEQVNLQDETMKLAVVNNGLDLARKSGYLHMELAAMDPLTLQNETFGPALMRVLGVDYHVTTLVKALQISGAAATQPRHVNATSPTRIALGADVDGQVRVNGSVHLTIEQLHRKWWQWCWTSWWRMGRCAPAETDVDMSIAWLKPSATVETQLVMLKCPQKSDRACSDVGVSDFISAVLRRSLDKLETRLLRRVKQLAVAKAEFSFDELAELSIRFHDASSIARSITDAAARLSKSQVNKKGVAYRKMVAFTEEYASSTANEMIEDQLGSRFGATCYDS